MRALVCKEYGPPESLVLEERPDPQPGPGEVRVEVKAAGINFPDVLVIAGNYQVKIPPPFVPGNEAAGVVEAVGEGVNRLKPGDRGDRSGASYLPVDRIDDGELLLCRELVCDCPAWCPRNKTQFLLLRYGIYFINDSVNFIAQ